MFQSFKDALLLAQPRALCSHIHVGSLLCVTVHRLSMERHQSVAKMIQCVVAVKLLASKVEKWSTFDTSMQASANEVAAIQQVLANVVICGNKSIAAYICLWSDLAWQNIGGKINNHSIHLAYFFLVKVGGFTEIQVLEIKLGRKWKRLWLNLVLFAFVWMWTAVTCS